MFNLKISDMKLTKELIVDVLNNNKTDLYDEGGNVIHGIDAVDFGYAADEILNQLEDDEDMPPQLQQTHVSGSLPQSTATYMLLAGGRTLITGTFDECKDYADKLVKPVGTKLNIVNVVWRQ